MHFLIKSVTVTRNSFSIYFPQRKLLQGKQICSHIILHRERSPVYKEHTLYLRINLVPYEKSYTVVHRQLFLEKM